MKFLKVTLIVIGVVIVVFLIAGLLLKKDYTIERTISINKSKQEVYDYIKMLRNQDNYSVWNRRDPNMTKTYTGEDGTVGFTYAWDSQNKEVGAGEQEIKKLDEGKRLEMELRFKRPFEMKGGAYMTTDEAGETQTTVKWGFNGSMPYPMNALMPFMGMDKRLGGDLEKGLNDLKMILEKQ
jgi:hypothetical protein